MPGRAVGTLDVQLRDGRVTTATIVAGDGRVRPSTLDAADARRLRDVPAGGGPRSVDLDGLDDYRVRAVTTAEGQVRITGLPQEDVDETLERQALSEAALFALVIAVGGLVTTRWVRRTMRPLDAVADTAREVAALPLTRGATPLPTTDPPARPAAEVEALRTAFELMLDHVDDALAARDATEQRLRRFVADAGHELRTPLATVRVNAEQAVRERTDVPEPTAAALARIDAAAVRMAALVEDLLLLARLDAAGSLGHEPVDLVRTAAEVVSEAQPLAPGHHWRLDLPGDAVTVAGDPDRMHQVVSNLVGNARQHTPAGTTVTVAVRREDTAACVVVTDDGPGIPAADQALVFDRFTRGDDGRARPAGGAGLGLAIARGLAEAHGGTLEVESRPGRTAFTLRVPTP